MSTFLSTIYRNVKEFYSEINAATLTGAIDVIVVEQSDGSYRCSPFHVRFGKLGVLKAKEKIVDIEINGNEVSLKMKLDDTGAAFFVEDVDEENEERWDLDLATSPFPEKFSPILSKSSLMPTVLFKEEFHAKIENIDDSMIKKGRLNKKKRRRKSHLKHNRKGSKSSLREVLLDNEMFEMDDVNDAEDELGGSEPEIGSSSVPANFDFDSYRRNMKNMKPKLEETVFQTPSSVDINTDDLATVDDREHRKTSGETDVKAPESVFIVTDEPPETVYIDTTEPRFHYFSEGEADRSEYSRPLSPGVVSDSEVDTRQEQVGVGWKWGELPTPAHAAHTSITQPEQHQAQPDTDPVGSGGSKKSWFGWSKSETSPKHEDGVYLDDIMPNPDLLPKYLHPIKAEPTDPLDITNSTVEQFKKEEHAVASTANNCEVLSEGEDDEESRNGLSLPMSPSGAKFDCKSEAANDLPSLISCHYPDLAASLCGGLSDSSITVNTFEKSLLTYEEFTENLRQGKEEGIMSNPNLVIRVHEKYLSWQRAAPILISILLYKQPLPSDIVAKLLKDGLDVNINISPEEIESQADDEQARKSSSWFGWWGKGKGKKDGEHKSDNEKENFGDLNESFVSSSPNIVVPDPHNEADDKEDPLVEKRKFKKSMRLSSEQISGLNLQSGMNEVQFSVTTAFQGTCVARCHIFLWKHTDKLVISDIDGTITKSDVLGHILPVIGKDWAHSGVADLYSKIEENGYKIMYLSARAIGQSSITKEYLQSVKQGDIFLPDGPVFLNPDSLIHAFKREVIDRNPEEFKIRCLKDIQSLFSSGVNPFFAGYGNRPNDAFAYRAVGIPVSRIFTINPTGKLKHEFTQNFTSSYIEQDAMVDLMFPPHGKDGFDPEFKTSDFSCFGFWRDTLVEIDQDSLEGLIDTKEETEAKLPKP